MGRDGSGSRGIVSWGSLVGHPGGREAGTVGAGYVVHDDASADEAAEAAGLAVES